MNLNKLRAGILVIIFLFLITLKYYLEILKINWTVLLIVNRGILAPNCFWWQMSETFLKDASGIDLFYNLKNKYNNQSLIPTTVSVKPKSLIPTTVSVKPKSLIPTTVFVKPKSLIPINFLGTPVQMVTDVGIVREILDQSPTIFGVGKLKYRMFKSFMKYNVGVSEGLAWFHRRELNVQVLNTGHFHRYVEVFNNQIRTVLNDWSLIDSNGQSEIAKFIGLPTNFEQFSRAGKQITNLIVFGKQEYCPAVYQIFGQANSIWALLGDNYQIPASVMQPYRQYILENLRQSQSNCLVELAGRFSQNEEDLYHQVPHWIFPTVGLVNTSFPRLLLVLNNHPEKFRKVVREITKATRNSDNIIGQMGHLRYLRYCILELLRLNNPVVTTFRTLLRDYEFKSDQDQNKFFKTMNQTCHQYQKGTQFLILNNPFLRDPSFYEEPNRFVPERWAQPGLEDSYYAIMFNQGPQKCPGKDLSIFILMSLMINYSSLANFEAQIKSYDLAPNSHQMITEFLVSDRIDTDNIPQMMNPCNLKFGFPETQK